MDISYQAKPCNPHVLVFYILCFLSHIYFNIFKMVSKQYLTSTIKSQLQQSLIIVEGPRLTLPIGQLGSHLRSPSGTKILNLTNKKYFNTYKSIN